MLKRAVYPGTFDPFTLGHLDIVERAVKIFDDVIIAVANPRHKEPLLPIDVRKNLIIESVSHLKNVSVMEFEGLLVDFLKKLGIRTVIRGLRAVSDYDYELKMAWINKKLYDEMETIFLLSSEQFAYLSSSFVKEIFSLGGDIRPFVPKAVAEYLENLRKGTF
ncbi:pantetheine-phosphate adenylyltransferase [Candidatus Caldipriscus sp.]|nr:pantetheine-phosphate adenylyltransferase [Candidatus Caldipriscus sp.]